MEERLRIVRLLVDAGARSDAKGGAGQTPRDVADEFEEHGIAQFLARRELALGKEEKG